MDNWFTLNFSESDSAHIGLIKESDAWSESLEESKNSRVLFQEFLFLIAKNNLHPKTLLQEGPSKIMDFEQKKCLKSAFLKNFHEKKGSERAF